MYRFLVDIRNAHFVYFSTYLRDIPTEKFYDCLTYSYKILFYVLFLMKTNINT